MYNLKKNKINYSVPQKRYRSLASKVTQLKKLNFSKQENYFLNLIENYYLIK